VLVIWDVSRKARDFIFESCNLVGVFGVNVHIHQNNMKQIVSFGLTTFIIFFLVNCKKNSVSANDMNTSILGNWDILNDSAFVGVGVNNHQASYIGQTGDYFDIRTDGFIYIKEGSDLDTLKYNLTSDSTIVIASFGLIANGVPEISQITDLTAHSATINAPTAITPGGEFWRKVILKR